MFNNAISSHHEPNPINSEEKSATMITLAEPSDGEAIARVAIQTYIETYGVETRATAESLYDSRYIKEVFPSLVTDKKTLFAVAKQGGSVVGFAKMLLQEDNLAFLDKLYVLKSQHDQGNGTRLLRFCLQKASEQGTTKSKLVVYSKNVKAMGFYEKQGFRKTDEKEYFFLPDGRQGDHQDDVMRCDDIQKMLRPAQSQEPGKTSALIQLSMYQRKPEINNEGPPKEKQGASLIL